MTSTLRTPALLGLLGALLLPAGAVRADEATVKVILLSIRPAEGDVEFAQNLTAALRNELSRLPGWEVDERQPTLNQMLLVAECEEPDAACLGRMAEVLEVDRILYGNVRRTAAGSDYDYAVSLFAFDARQGRITHSIAETIPRIRSDIDDLRERARKYARQFAGIRRTGTLRITANHPGARVLLDGEEAGVLDEEGTLTIDDVPVGRHDIEVEAPEHTSFRGSVVVVADEEVGVEVELRRRGEGFSPSVPTLVAGGVALVSWGMVIASGVVLSGAEADLDGYRSNGTVLDPDYGAWSEHNPNRGNMCTWAQRVRDEQIRRPDGTPAFNSALVGANGALKGILPACDTADTWEPIWLASMVAAGVSTVATAALFYLDLARAEEGEEREPSASRVRLVPSLALDADRAVLQLHGTF